MKITSEFAKMLIKNQFPCWQHLDITPIIPGGHDNKSFRLGETLLMRMPSQKCYVAQVNKEQHWLPILAKSLSINIPEPVAKGRPCKDYPWDWSIYRWIEGEVASKRFKYGDAIFADDLARFIAELHCIDISAAPPPGEHNFYRGGELAIYDLETRAAIKHLSAKIDEHSCLSLWNKALESTWENIPVWIHGDLSPENVLLQSKKLRGIIDFGCMAVGDPACDLVITWTFLQPNARRSFKERLSLDDATWTRARGWALWKALITLEQLSDDSSWIAREQCRIIHECITDDVSIT